MKKLISELRDSIKARSLCLTMDEISAVDKLISELTEKIVDHKDAVKTVKDECIEITARLRPPCFRTVGRGFVPGRVAHDGKWEFTVRFDDYVWFDGDCAIEDDPIDIAKKKIDDLGREPFFE